MEIITYNCASYILISSPNLKTICVNLLVSEAADGEIWNISQTKQKLTIMFFTCLIGCTLYFLCFFTHILPGLIYYFFGLIPFFPLFLIDKCSKWFNCQNKYVMLIAIFLLFECVMPFLACFCSECMVYRYHGYSYRNSVVTAWNARNFSQYFQNVVTNFQNFWRFLAVLI